MTQVELAAVAGASPATVSNLELGKRPARASTVRRLAAALHVRPWQLYGED